MNGADFASVLVSGLILGSIYALMASGLSLVWTTLGIFNFAHGAFMMLGAYVAWTVGTQEGLGLGPTLGIVAAVVLLAALGCLVELLLLRPFYRFYRRPNLIMLTVITTLSGMVFLENSAMLTWGPRLKQLTPLATGDVGVLGVTISAQEALIMVVSPLFILATWLWLRFTLTGRAIRAVGQNQDSAQLLGMNISALYMTAFGLSAALAAAAGVLLGSIRFVSPGMGGEPLTKALIVAIFGGLGSILGTVAGAYVIGLLEAICNYTVGLYWTPAILFLVMIVTLMIRPSGLFGRRS
jgi:branched-chain amino acid transport system permease protein